ncbi:MAG: hypothetical protein GTO17_13690 [Candidatus Aminicenantes bacterium]|nr:hypothetical protein [Candidatus Aminicenantes bacterium]
MKIYSLYKDFFIFLDKTMPHLKQWKIYSTHYYEPHKEFLENYFSHFPFINFSSLKQRVESIKTSDYSLLRDLISGCSPEQIIKEAYQKCRRLAPPKQEPNVYLLIGFFSPEGFILKFKRKPVICFGLERFNDFRLLRILFTHEYAHFLLHSSKGEVPERKNLEWLLISEGIATCFSYLTFPNFKLYDHLLFSRDRLNWCQENERYLKEVHGSGTFTKQELMDFYHKGSSELSIPPRAGKYLGFLAVKKYLANKRKKNIGLLLSDKKLALSLEL